MAEGRIAELSRRGVVAVSGPDARTFLNDLITAEVGDLGPGSGVYGGLLTPQGKILFDFIAMTEGDRFLFDLPRAFAADFVQRLSFYRLRAKVEIADRSGSRRVFAAWGDGGLAAIDGVVVPDPRLPALGFRAISAATSAPEGFTPADEADYDAHRIGLGVPEGGIDFAFGDTFPHDADMDQLAGVDFAKGCFIGQEVVSRMQHRGTARRRIVQLAADGPLPPPGTEIKAGERPIGTLASNVDRTGLALVRLDRAKEAIDAGTPLMAGATTIALSLPKWASFGWPATVEGE
jgi:tRNA-modifying protein YgfZ